jgi:hypothetical protein
MSKNDYGKDKMWGNERSRTKNIDGHMGDSIFLTVGIEKGVLIKPFFESQPCLFDHAVLIRGKS